MYSPRTNILVMGDDTASGQLLVDLIRERGYEAALVSNGSDGLKALAGSASHDLLVIDLNIPDLERWLLLSRLRSTPLTARLPVIM